ncbi:sodium:proton antiporter [Streptomyces sp. CA-111067]|uniref:sodium:proton antiporter n=1 Tax=Streptomyces sp. CA-111067 TaxID=3240046 RepID=UPI003D97CF3D
MTALPFVAAGWIFLIGLYGMVTSRNLVHAVGSLAVAQSSTYVLLIGVGFRHGGTAPVFSDIPVGSTVVDPVVQALVLTDIVVGATVTALLLSLVIQIRKRTGTVDPEALTELRG